MTLKNTVGFPQPVSGSVRILIADPFPVILHGLRKMIEDDGRFRVIAEVSSIAAFVFMVTARRPEIALLDASLALECQHLLVPLIRSEEFSTSIILLTSSKDPDEDPNVTLLGASRVLSKCSTAKHLLATISSVSASDHSTGFAKTPGESSKAKLPNCGEVPAPGIGQLTKRERQLLPLVCDGLKNKEIASCLGIAESTVWHHLTSVFTKLGVEDRLGLVAFAYKHKLLHEGGAAIPILTVKSA